MFMALGIICMLAMPIVLVAGMIKPKLVMPWMEKPTRWLVPVWLLILFFATGTFALLDKKPSENIATQSPSVPPIVPEYRPHPAPPSTPTHPQMQASEAGFIAAIVRARAAYDAAPNELKKSNVRIDMERDMHSAVGNFAVTNWTGTLRKLGTNGDGDALVEIEIADGILRYPGQHADQKPLPALQRDRGPKGRPTCFVRRAPVTPR
jgi:hypothetical protein